MSEQAITVDISKIRMAIHSGIPLSVTTYTLPHNMEVYMNEVLTAFFKELRQEHMIQYLIYCQNELITNAKKANTKRIFFSERGLDINNVEDYEEGMKSFKAETLSNINFYLSKQKKAGLYVRLIIQLKDNVIRVEVHNNSDLTYIEFKRIHDKLCRAQQYTSIEETLNQILDESEGAGLGIIILILMLRKLGLSEDNFQMFSENGVTISRLLLPISEQSINEINTVAKEFEDGIKVLPQFPENITRLNGLLSKADVELNEVAANIANDPSLTGELLKQVNSAMFAHSEPCCSISEAVKMIGLRGVRNMLFTVGTLQVFSKLPSNSEKLWTHSYRVAFFSFNIAYNFFHEDRDIIENTYTCGLLHDMGKIIFEAAHPQYLEKIKKLCFEKGIDAEVFEKAVSGVNHGEIGARIAEKWNFPSVLANVIRFHHSPEKAPEDCQKVAACVYLADLMIHFLSNEVDFYQIDMNMLNRLGINVETEERFKTIAYTIQRKLDE